MRIPFSRPKLKARLLTGRTPRRTLRHRTVTPQRQRFIEDLQLRSRAPKTIEVYVYHVRQFAAQATPVPVLV